jgi:hypothetical protein
MYIDIANESSHKKLEESLMKHANTVQHFKNKLDTHHKDSFVSCESNKFEFGFIYMSYKFKEF